MLIRNVNFDSGIFSRLKAEKAVLELFVHVLLAIAPGSPLAKVPLITFEVKVGCKGINLHRQQFPLRVCYAVTIIKSQGQKLTTVGLDLHDVFLPRPPLRCSKQNLCEQRYYLVSCDPSVSSVASVMLPTVSTSPSFSAATREGIPTVTDLFYSPPNHNTFNYQLTYCSR